MNQMIAKVRHFVVSEDGPTAVEYAVLMGLIIVALVTVVKNLAGSISGTFSQVSSTLAQRADVRLLPTQAEPFEISRIVRSVPRCRLSNALQ